MKIKTLWTFIAIAAVVLFCLWVIMPVMARNARCVENPAATECIDRP